MSDQDDVAAAFEALDRAFDRHDTDAIVELFAADADITLWGSALPEKAVGRNEMRAMLARLFDAYPAGSFRLEYSERRIRVVGDVAWINAAGRATWAPGDGGREEVAYRVTGILLRTERGWRWHTQHGSEPTPLDL